MRGALSAGSLFGIYLLGYRASFDRVYACSAGAVNAAYFLSNQGEAGISVYFDSLNNRNFLNPLRVWKIVDVSYAYDYVVSVQKPLDESAIRASGTRFFVSATNVQTGKSEYIDVNQSRSSVPDILKASSALPVLYNAVVEIDGLLLVDGGISSTTPIARAIADGCTDILVLSTRPPIYECKPGSPFERLMLWMRLGWKYPALQQAYRRRHVLLNAERSLANGENVPEGVNLAVICPHEGEHAVDRLTLNREKLLVGAFTMARRTFRAFAADQTPLDLAFERLRSGEADRVARAASVTSRN